MEHKLVLKEKLDIIPKSAGKIVDLTKFVKEEYSRNRMQIINYIRRIPSVVNSLNQIKAGELYKAVVPPKYISKIKDQSVNLKQMENGLFCPTLANAGSGKFICHVQLEQVNPKIFELSSQLALQSAIADLTSQLEEINVKIDKILMGQQNDRLALVDSCEQQFLEAVNVDDEVFRKFLMANVIKTGNDARAQLMKTFKDDIKYIQELPSKDEKFKIQYLNLTDKNFNKEISSRMNSLYETYRAIGRSSMVLMFVYQGLGQDKNIEISLKPLQGMLQEISNNKSIQNKLYEYDIWDKQKEVESVWYREPVQAIKSINETVARMKNINQSTWELEIKGEELLEGDIE